MKRLLFFLFVCVLVLPVSAETITVLSFDVWSGLTYGGVFSVRQYEDSATREFRFDLLKTGIASIAPDVIALQEANPLPAYGERLAEELDLDLIYDVRQAGARIGPVGLPTNLREGDVLLAKRDLALSELGTTQLQGPGAGNVASFQFGAGSQLVAAEIQVEGRQVFVFSTRWTPSPHAQRDRLVSLVDEYDDGDLAGDDLVNLIKDAVSGSQRRQEESQKTLITINEMAGENPVILLGSMHALPGSPEIQMLREAGFIDVWDSVGRGAGYTWDARNNSNIIDHGLASGKDTRERVDYIFVRGNGIAPRSAAVVFSRPTFGVHPSDHFGVIAEIRIDAQ